MSGQGMVTTARGEILNLDNLIEQAKRPIGVKDQASEKQKRVVPQKRNLNVRAFAPTLGETEVPEVPEEVQEALRKKNEAEDSHSTKSIPSSFRRHEDGRAQSIADLTGIRIEEVKHLKPKDMAGKSKEEVKNEVLGEILTGLEKDNPNAEKAAKDAEEQQKKTKRTARKSAKQDADDVSDMDDFEE